MENTLSLATMHSSRNKDGSPSTRAFPQSFSTKSLAAMWASCPSEGVAAVGHM
jgi:hypothetical protein